MDEWMGRTIDRQNKCLMDGWCNRKDGRMDVYIE